MRNTKFWKGFGAGVAAMAMVMLLFVGTTVATGALDVNSLFASKSSHLFNRRLDKKIQEMESYIGNFYFDKLDESKVEDSICNGLMNGLGDTYAAYYNKDAYEQLTERTSGKYCGIGAYVSQNTTTGAISIAQTVKDSPAQKAGLKSGDIIYSVDGTVINGKDLTSVSSMLKGKPGTKIKLQIIRKGKNDYLPVTVTRQTLTTDTVESRMFSGKIGYIAVSSFEEVTAKQFTDAVNKLEKQGEKGLIIDLRNNGGGILDTAISMLDRILPKKLVVYTKNKNGKVDEYYAKDKQYLDTPIAILVNGNSASASEVFSGCLQDYKKAVLVGTQTFGKGIVQTLFHLSDGTAIKLTTSKYYSPKGRNIHGTGLTPDYIVKQDDAISIQGELNPQKDKQLKKAMEYLSQK